MEFEREFKFKEAGLRSLRVVYTPDTDEHGRVRGWIASILDISDRKRAEEARARLLASEQAARAQAEEANRAKDQFLATVSHELRTPLNAIMGWAAMLEQRRRRTLARQEGLQSINRNTRTLAQLVDDLLDVSRMIGGKMRSTSRRWIWATSSTPRSRRSFLRPAPRTSASMSSSTRPAAR